MFIDIIVGCIIGVIVGVFSDTTYPFWVLFFSIGAALAPDVDFLIYAWRHDWKIGKFAHEHRDLLHHPVWFSLGGAWMVSLCLPMEFALVWCIATLAHFVHDTLDGGWGVRWIPWPLPRYRWYFTLASYSQQKVYRSLEVQREVAADYGNDDWFKEEKQSSIDKIVIIVCIVVIGLVVIFVKQ